MNDVGYMHIGVHGELLHLLFVLLQRIYNSKIMTSITFAICASESYGQSTKASTRVVPAGRLEARDEMGVWEIIPGGSRCVFLQSLLAKDGELARQLAYVLAVVCGKVAAAARALCAQVASPSPQVAAYLAAGDVISWRREEGRTRRANSIH